MQVLFVVCDDFRDYSYTLEWYCDNYIKARYDFIEKCFEKDKKLYYRLKDKTGEEILIKWLTSKDVLEEVEKYKDSIKSIDIDLFCGNYELLESIVSRVGKGRITLLNGTRPWKTGYNLDIMIDCLSKIRCIYGNLNVRVSEYNTVHTSELCGIERLKYENNILNIVKGF